MKNEQSSKNVVCLFYVDDPCIKSTKSITKALSARANHAVTSSFDDIFTARCGIATVSRPSVRLFVCPSATLR